MVLFKYIITIFKFNHVIFGFGKYIIKIFIFNHVILGSFFNFVNDFFTKKKKAKTKQVKNNTQSVSLQKKRRNSGHTLKSGEKKKICTDAKRTNRIAHLQVCRFHKVIAPYTCTYCVRTTVCDEVFCDICVSDRKRICVMIGKNNTLCKLKKFMCNTHFDELANKVLVHNEGISPQSISYEGTVQSRLLQCFVFIIVFFIFILYLSLFFSLYIKFIMVIFNYFPNCDIQNVRLHFSL